MRIDYVVPMVFDDDVLLQQDYRRFFGSPMPRNSRFRSWGTEELLVRCIRKNMPWVNTIFILLARDSQKKDWMTGDGIRVVYHRDFIPEKYLPCFNSCTIEMFLPFIEYLSEFFIYGNDDMFPLSPLKETDFFENYLPCLHYTEKNWPASMNIFHKKCKRQQEMLSKWFGYNDNGKWLHGGHSLVPLVKSSCTEARMHYDYDVITGITPYRSVTSYNHYLYALWQYMSRRYVDYAPVMTYTCTLDGISQVIECIDRPDTGILCINDSGGENDFKAFSSAVRQALEQKLTKTL